MGSFSFRVFGQGIPLSLQTFSLQMLRGLYRIGEL